MEPGTWYQVRGLANLASMACHIWSANADPTTWQAETSNVWHGKPSETKAPAGSKGCEPRSATEWLLEHAHYIYIYIYGFATGNQ